jgi:molybdopterin-guanine dinucleotide biosynthesis protein A
MNDPEGPEPTFGALILAGGLSSRMGTDKASLPYGAQTLLEHMRAIAGRAGARTILVGGGPYGDLPDPVAEAGPAASLWALARTTSKVATNSRWVVIPVDMPLLERPLLRRLVAAGPRAAFFAGHPLPLALTMDNATRDVLERMGERLSAGKSISVHHVLELLGADTLSPDATERAQLVNANTREEWNQLMERGSARR